MSVLFLRALGLFAGASLTAVLWGMLIERRLYVRREVTIKGALRQPGSFTVLHISDLHLTRGQAHRERFLRRLAADDYDVVVATGDLLGGFDQEQRCVEILAELTKGRLGVAVLGSHDLFASRPIKPWQYFTRAAPRPHGEPLQTDTLIDGLTGSGWAVLRGEIFTYPSAVGVVQFGGFDDPHLEQTVWPTADDLAVQGDVACAIGVIHAPYTKALDLLHDAGYDVLLAGHTHGGQVRVPGIGALTVNCDLPRRQGRGLSRYRNRWLHVSAGVGHDPSAPYRFACRPEVTRLTFEGPSFDAVRDS